MISTGLCSISFRGSSIDEIIDLCRRATIDGIEWGGDTHVPPGDLEWAGKVREQTEAAGLVVSSYGAYYRSEQSEGDFSPTLDTAIALGAPVIRIWAGTKGSEDADPAYRSEVVECIRQATERASAKGIAIALEYHGGTLTDTMESAHQLLAEVGRPELKLYWQPRAGGIFENDLVELKAALPHLSHVHCFHWGPEGWNDKRALSEGAGNWSTYLDTIKSLTDDRFVILEFVKDGSPEQFFEDAHTLKALLAK